MNRIVKDGLWLGAIGFALGAAAGAAMLLLVRPEAFAAGAGALAAHILLSGLYGAVGMGACVVYRLERWSITRATAVHLLVTLGGLYALGLAQGWLSLSLFGFVVPTAGFILVYFVIWLAQCLSYRRKVSQMNLKLKKWRSSRGAKQPPEYS